MLRRVARTVARVLVRTLTTSGWLVVFVLLLPVSAVLHLDTTIAKRAASYVAVTALESALKGRFAIGDVRRIEPALGSVGLELSEVVIRDPSGRRIIRAHRVVVRGARLVRPTWTETGDIGIRIDSIELDGTAVRLIRRRDLLPTIVSAFEPRSASSDGGGPKVRLELPSIRLQRAVVWGEPPGIERLRADGIRAHVAITIDDGVELAVRQLALATTSPFGRYRATARGVIRAGEAERRTRATAHPIAAVQPPPVTDPAGAEIDLVVEASAMEGPERARARLRFRGDAVGVRIEDSLVTRRTLEPFGVQVPLVGAFVVRGQLGGRLDAMHVDATAVSDGGRAHVRGELPIGRPLRIEADVTDIDLARVIAGAPESRITGRLVLTPGRRGLPLRIDVTSQRSLIAGFDIPPIVATADVDPEARRITLQPAETRDPHLTARVEGTVGFDASIDLLLDADDVHIRSLPLPDTLELPVLGGIATANARVRFLPAAPDEGRPSAWMSVAGRLRARALRVGPLTAASATYSGTLSGAVGEPTIRGTVAASGVRVSALGVGDVRARVIGGPSGGGRSTFGIDVEAHGVTSRDNALRRTGDVRARLRFGIDDGGFSLDASELAIAFGELRWRGQIDGLRVGRRGDIVLRRALLAAGSQRIEASAQRHGRRRIEGSVVAQSLDLSALLAFAPESVPVRRGRLDISARSVWEGRFTRLEVEAGLAEATIGPLENVAGVVTLGYDGETVVFDSQATLDTGGSVALGGRIDRAPDERDLVRSFVEGAWALDGYLDAVDLRLVRAVWPVPTPTSAAAPPAAAPVEAARAGETADAPSEPPELGGTITGSVRLSGTLEVPRGEASLEGADLTFEGSPPVQAALTAGFADGAGTARVVVRNQAGPLAELEVRSPIDLETIGREPERAMATLRAADWHAVARLQPITLGDLFATLPPSMRPELEDPIALRVAGELTATGPEEDLAVALTGRVVWIGDADELLLTSAPQAQIEGSFRGGEARVRADVGVRSRQVLSATAHAPMPLVRWMRGERAPVPPIAFAVTGDRVPASLVAPLRAGRMGGTFDIRAVGSGVLDEPSGRVLLRGNDVTLGGVPIGSFTLTATADDTRLRGDLDLAARREGRTRGRPGVQAHVEIPIRWRGGVTPVIRDDDDLLVSATMSGQPIRPFAPFVPGVRDARGLLDGDIEYRGTLASGRWNGAVRLFNATIDVAAAGQRLDEVRAEVRLSGDRIELVELRALDGGDEVRASGHLRLRGLAPRSGTIRARFDDFPIRNEGQILARLQGRLDTDLAFEDQELSANVVPRELFVRLPDRPPGQIQSLAPNPDIEVVGEERPEEQRGEAGFVYRIWFAGGDREIWVRRSDFSVRTVTDVRLRYDGRDLGMTGSIEITRGWVEMLGKRFELDRGRVVFDNPDELDPALNITARHEVAAASTIVTVEIGGRVTHPVITFTSDPPLGSESEVIALLVTGRGQEDQSSSSAATGDLSGQAAQQAGNIVAGLTVGLVQSRVREEAPWLQVFTVDQSGERYRIRAGVPITPPRFLRPVLTNVFVQLQTEFEQSASGSQTAAATGASAADPFSGILELTHPGNLRSTLSAGSTSGRFGIDFTWDVPIE